MNPGRMSLGMVEAGHYLLENVYLAGNFTILLKIFSLSLPIPQPQLLPPPHYPQQHLFLLYLVSFQIAVLELCPSTKLWLN